MSELDWSKWPDLLSRAQQGTLKRTEMMEFNRYFTETKGLDQLEAQGTAVLPGLIQPYLYLPHAHDDLTPKLTT